MSQMDFKSNSYCRLCLEDLKKDKQLSLNDKFGEIVLFTALETLTGITDTRNDQFTKKICTKCAEQIRMAHGVRQKALDADMKLRNSLVTKETIIYEEEYHQENNGVADEKSDLIEEFLDEDIIYEPIDQDIPSEFFKHQDVQEEDTLFELELPNQEPVNGDSDYDNYDEFIPQGDIPAENLYYCCKCTDVFAEEEELISHFSEQHKEFQHEAKRVSESRRIDRTECTLCGIWVKNLQKHRTLQHLMGPIKYTCKDCGRSFRDIKSRKKCEAKHAGLDMRLKCPKCPKVLSSSRSLYNHLRAHDKPKPTLKPKKRACNICGIMVSPSYLAIHNRIHTGERPYSCSYCNKTFIHNIDHKRHEMMHTGERPYKCEVPNCEAGFVKKSYLTIHIEKRHPDLMTY